MGGGDPTELPVLSSIRDDSLRANLVSIRDAVGAVWAAGPVVRDYTDHGPAHSARVLAHAAKVLACNRGEPWTDVELYLLVAAALLHDLGMQVDATGRPGIVDEARKRGAEFQVEFAAPTPSEYSRDEQDAIRRNHQHLSAAWLRTAVRSGRDTALDRAIRSMQGSLAGEVADVVASHSKSDIRQCEPTFLHDGEQRKLMIAAVLRLADEMDIGRGRVRIDTVIEHDLPVEHAVWWWLHNATEIDLKANGTGILRIDVLLDEADFAELSKPIAELVIGGFRRKNAVLVDVLCKSGIPIHIDEESGPVAKLVRQLPDEIKAQIESMAEQAPPQTLDEMVEMDPRLRRPPSVRPIVPLRPHWGEPARLVDMLADASDEAGLDLLVELAPRRVRDIAYREELLAVFSLGAVAEKLQAADLADRYATIVRCGDTRDLFVLEDGPEVQRAQHVWDEQMEVVAYDVQFAVQVRGSWEPGRRGLHQHLHLETVFLPHDLPLSVREPEAVPGDTAALVVRVDTVDVAPDELVIAAAEDRLRPWLQALTFARGVGITILDATANPVFRRYPSVLLGPEEKLIKPVAASEGLPLVQRIEACYSAGHLIDQLAGALNAGSLADGARLLWRAIEEENGRVSPPLLGKQRLRQVERYLRKALGEAQGTLAASALDRVPTRSAEAWVAELLRGTREDLSIDGAHREVEELKYLVEGERPRLVPHSQARRAFDGLVAVVRYLIDQHLAAPETRPPSHP